MKTIRLLLFCLGLVASTSVLPNTKNTPSLDDLYKSVFGEDTQSLPNQIQINLSIHNKNSSTIHAKTKDNTVSELNRVTLLSLLRKYLKPKDYRRINTKTQTQTWISVQQLEEFGITADYDRMTISMNLNIKKSMINRRMIALINATGGRYQIVPEHLLEPADFSAYVNLFSSFSYRHHNNDSNIRLRAASAINVKGLVLEDQHSIQFKKGDDHQTQVRRDHTRIVIDKPEYHLRYQVGDINTSNRNFQTRLNLLGIKMSKETIWSHTKEHRPQNNYQFNLDSDADIDVYLDGHFFKDIKLKAGEHRLGDIGANRGNQVKLVINDAFGKTTVKKFTRFSDTRALKKGFKQYAMNIGIPSRKTSDGLEYDDEKTLTSAYFQAGITDTLTLGVDFLSDGQAHQFGTDAIWLTPYANINTGFAYTLLPDRENGYALRLQTDNNAVANRFNWSVSAEHFSDGFILPDQFSKDNEQTENRRKHQLNADINYAFARQMDLNISYGQFAYYDKGTESYTNIGLTRSTKQYGNFSLSASYSEDSDGVSDHSILLNYSLALNPFSRKERRKNITARYNSQNDSNTLTYRIGKKSNHGIDSLNGSLKLESRHGQQALSGDVKFIGKPVLINAAHRASINDSTGEVKRNTNLNMNTALVFADGHVAISQPVSDSFAILLGPEGLNHPMAVKRGRGLFKRSSNDLNEPPTKYDVLINPKHKAVLPRLRSYRVQHLSADSAVLPDGLDINSTEFDLMPDYKSGYVIKIGEKKGFTFNARLTDSKGRALTLLGGQLQAQHSQSGSDKPTLFFTDEYGDILVHNLKAGSYQMSFFSEVPVVNVDIQNKHAALKQGGLVCIGLDCGL